MLDPELLKGIIAWRAELDELEGEQVRSRPKCGPSEMNSPLLDASLSE
ncbi:hypothetical protein ACFYNY_32745 [Streptomyces sp. NPDC006530]